ncbi:MAG: DUF1667 domain-containing protein [Firmicutes bacterium]|nr:DUF1667 domain-containing protein [Bacillota bacterium]
MKTICIVCPVGCELNIKKADRQITVTGHECIRGRDYGVKEYTAPERIVTTIVPLPDGQGTAALKTDKAIDKRLVKDALLEISRAQVSPVLKPGYIFIKNLLGTGANVVVTCINKEK